MKRLWYRQPAKSWNEALPLGNGRLGAMVYGTAEQEHLQLNEDSVWYGKYVDRVNPDAKQNLDKVRKLIFDGKIPEAEELLLKAFAGTPNGMRGYQTLGDMRIQMNGLQGVEEYTRELSLDEAIHVVRFKDNNGCWYVRETMISEPDQVLIMHIEAEKQGMLNLDITLDRDMFFDELWAENNDTIAYQGSLGEGGFRFAAMCSAVATEGTVSTLGEHLLISNTKEATILLTAATTFRFNDILAICRDYLEKSKKKSYYELKSRHIKDYKSFFDRVELQLDYDTSLDELTTEERLKRISEEQEDNGLLTTYFQYGRYLLISSSRQGTLPANLQGIWNQDMKAAWGSKFTININAEMNYWPAEITNLSELHEPLFYLLKKVYKTGKNTAEKMYNCRGFVAHHNTDIHGDSAPQDLWIPGSFWVMGGAWLCTHIWEHYLFTRDLDFLEEYYDILKEAVVFFEDFLVQHGDYLVTCPSVSPENTYILPDGTKGCVCAGAAMDSQILHDLFTIYCNAANVLDVDHDYVDVVEKMKQKLPPIKVGKHGQIMEWLEDYDEEEPGHRHISHLYALYPSSQITMDGNKALSEAAKKTLERRLAHGGGHTGWSLAWIINLYARLWDSENAKKSLIRLLSQSTLPNMLDNHPPFQIDGNFGGTAAIAEMLVQSNNGRVILAPALPKSWISGKVSGLCLRNGAEISLQWMNGNLTSATITARHDYNSKIYYGDKVWEVSLKKGETIVLIP